jgi:hypothetical protein
VQKDEVIDVMRDEAPALLGSFEQVLIVPSSFSPDGTSGGRGMAVDSQEARNLKRYVVV